MSVLTGQLNNREWATLFWLGVFLIWFFGNRERRNLLQPHLWALLNSLLDKTILIIVLLMVLYISLSVNVLKQVGIWNATDHLKDTILWAITMAFALVIHVNNVQKDNWFFHKVVKDSIIFTFVLAYLVELYPFSLPIELVLPPIGLFVAVFEQRRKGLLSKKLSGWLLALFGVVTLGHTLRNSLADMGSFLSFDWLTELLLPFILTLLFLPFIYFLALFGAYNSVFARIDIQNRDSNLIGYAKRRIILSFSLRLRKLLKWSKKHPNLKFNDKNSLIKLIEEPIQSAKNSLNISSLSTYRGLAEPLMNRYRQLINQIDPNFEDVKKRQSAIAIFSELKALQLEAEQIEAGSQFPLKHETLLYTIKHTLDALMCARKNNYVGARQALNRALLNQQRFDNWNADIEPIAP